MTKAFELNLYDTLTQTKKSFSEQIKVDLNVYVCGITPYNFSHLGHGRSYINFDVLIRLLRFIGCTPKYVRNFTDIDDKLLKRAEQQFGSQHEYRRIAEVFMSDFHEQMKKLNCLAPDVEPLATESIDSIVELVQKLLAKGVAYKSGNDVFFDISKFERYGQLSKKKISELEAGSRVELNVEKKNPMDFVLWKGNSENNFWDTALGYGRPGWHIECSAMINKNCVGSLDIHGGGADLIFPHHENEIAQSEAAIDHPLTDCWVHNGLLSVDQEKMSKSGSNSLAMSNFFENYSPADFRFYVLQHHYRSPIDFLPERVVEAGKAREKLASLKKISGIGDLDSIELKDLRFSLNSYDADDLKMIEELLNSLLDDLGTAKMIGLLFKNFDVYKQRPGLASYVVRLCEEVLGISFVVEESSSIEETSEISILLDLRREARANKNWAVADEIRSKLLKLGYEVKDEKK